MQASLKLGAQEVLGSGSSSPQHHLPAALAGPSRAPTVSP